MDYEWIEKTILKKQIKKKKKTENQCQNAARETKKPLARNENLSQTKNYRPIMSREWIGKTI